MLEIVMTPDYGSVFICESGDDTGITIGDEETSTEVGTLYMRVIHFCLR